QALLALTGYEEQCGQEADDEKWRNRHVPTAQTVQRFAQQVLAIHAHVVSKMERPRWALKEYCNVRAKASGQRPRDEPAWLRSENYQYGPGVIGAVRSPHGAYHRGAGRRCSV